MKCIELKARIEEWPLRQAFRITGHLWTAIEVLVVSLKMDGCIGRGEAAGIYYKHQTPRSMLDALERVRSRIEAGIDRVTLQNLLPVGGARNAVDCALWDLEAKLTTRDAWEIAALPGLKPLLTTFTCGAGGPDEMADAARGYKEARAIKLKLTGEAVDADRVRAVREARGDVWLGVDANQGFDLPSLERLMPSLVSARVAQIEQPFPIGRERLLEGFHSPIPLAADESVQGLKDIPVLVGRYDVVNIKLDKCGGLTEALSMVRKAQELGLRTMVGNMMGTSLAMAPAFLVGQLCEIVDLDGPIFLKQDRLPSARYQDGFIELPRRVWGSSNEAGEEQCQT